MSEPIKLSLVLSIHNRGRLFKRTLDSCLWQTMPRQNWEIVLVDDMSTEDLSKTYGPYLGQINLRHVKMDHTRHPVYREMNPAGSSDPFQCWYHTPAISTNLGCFLARGRVISLCHPEVLHAPWNFEVAERLLSSRKAYLFGLNYLGTAAMNEWLDARHENWTSRVTWPQFIEAMRGIGGLTQHSTSELYWYTSFLPKMAVEKVGGVDFTYLRGVMYEDDDFRDRVDLAGWRPFHCAGLEGFHQYHFDEKEKHRQRDTEHWKKGVSHNQAIYFARRTAKTYPQPANVDYDWTGQECLVEVLEFELGSVKPRVVAYA